jgi:pimeloyl-ACP methyl ester carboxylesterase
MRRYLSRLGYDARGWGFGTNTGDPRRDVERLAERVHELTEEKGSPASLIGWSLGGVIAREVARRHPEAVRRVITFGTPVAGGASHTSIARAHRRRADTGAERVTRRLHAEVPIRVPLTVMFSKRDGIVAWQACIDHSSPFAEHIEVSSTHIGMGVDPDVWAIVADRLGATCAVPH